MNMTPFQFETGAIIRTITKDGEPWFVAKDVCDVLGIKNVSDTLSKVLDADEKGIDTIDTLGGTQRVSIINESGLYALIMKSRKPQAQAFRKWVTSEVLPSIRKHGAYMTPDTIESALGDPDFMIGLLENLKEERAKRVEAERTKAYISDKKTATAMATASAEKRKRLALEDRLREGTRWMTVKAIPWFTEYFHPKNKGAYTKVGQVLAELSRDMACPARKVETMEGTRGAYHINISNALKDALDRNPEYLRKWRK